jgi:TatD family-associated radical SAM protein
MIVYTFSKQHTYIDFAASVKEMPEGLRTAYVNITNQCNCACTFCLRQFKEMAKENTLWLESEPTAAQIIESLEQQDWSLIREIVFCGFGEPTLRLDVLLEVMRYVKGKMPQMKTRLNTNGLSDLEYKKETAVLFAGLLDTISISLNASNEDEYLKLTRSKFGQGSYEAMLTFAQNCRPHIENVVLTVVDSIGVDEIKKCQAICDERGVTLRVRPYEAN